MAGHSSSLVQGEGVRQDSGPDDRCGDLTRGIAQFIVLLGNAEDHVPAIRGKIANDLRAREGTDAPAWWEVIADEEYTAGVRNGDAVRHRLRRPRAERFVRPLHCLELPTGGRLEDPTQR